MTFLKENKAEIPGAVEIKLSGENACSGIF